MSKLREISSARVPFAVKGAGHITNPGFSSTPGVHISMSRFNDIVVHEDSETVEIGAGLTWTDVYKHIVPKGINVVGGRIDGVGVAGLTLGGGMCDFFLVPHSQYEREAVHVRQDIPGKQTNMGSLWTPLRNSS